MHQQNVGRGTTVRRRAFALAVTIACATYVGHAQLRGVTAQIHSLAGADGVHPGGEIQVALLVTLPQGFHVQSDRPRDSLLIPTELAVEGAPPVAATEVVYPTPIDFVQAGADGPLAVFDREFAIGVRLAVASDAPPGTIAVPWRLRYQACDDAVCFAPTTAEGLWTVRIVPAGAPVTARHSAVFQRLAFGRGRAPAASIAGHAAAAPLASQVGDEAARLEDFEVRASTGGYLGAGDFLEFVRSAESGVQERGLLEGRGPLAVLVIVLLGGLALNLTPCVLPMAPITLAIIGAGAQAGSRRRGLLLGAAYGTAMALVYGALGLAVILTASTFGAINASPWFNAGIAAIFVVLGLAMFDVLHVDFSRLSARLTPAQGSRGSVLLSFTMGAVAALLAGACVAPVVIQVVLFSSSLYAAGMTAALALPFVLGIGMAVPWPIAGAGLAALPRPGPWMVRVKQAFGVLILSTAAYYGYVAYGILANRWVDPANVAASVEEKIKDGWYASLPEGLAVARREQRPVLIDVWATWCKNCLVMDRTTLAEPAVRSALAHYVKIKVQAEEPDREPARAVLQQLGAIGLPAYAILGPR